MANVEASSASSRNESEKLPLPTSKRRKLNIGRLDEIEISPTRSPSPDDDLISQSPSLSLSHVEPGFLSYPRSIYSGWKPPLPITREVDAIRHLMCTSQIVDRYTYFTLDSFCIYRPHNGTNGRNANEFVSLSRLSLDRFSGFLFDGILSCGNEKYYVEHIPFDNLTIDYDGSVSDCIWIQSKLASRSFPNVYYKLGDASTDYQRFYKPFVWLVKFTRHFIDYLIDIQAVTLSHFRSEFLEWLFEKRGDGLGVASWLKEAGLTDFRSTVNANAGFLWKECYAVERKRTSPERQPIWCEIDPQYLRAIPQQPLKETGTVVTQFTYECFQNMYFSSKLETRELDPHLWSISHARKKRLGLTPPKSNTPREITTGIRTPQSINSDQDKLLVGIGDVVCVAPEKDKGWRKSTAKLWYAYVQKKRIDRDQQTVLDVIWLYEPSDTTIGKSSYRFPNELFFSDNCGCGSEALALDLVIQKVKVSWFPTNPYEENDFFIRQKFATVTEHDGFHFAKLRQDEDFTCDCGRNLSVYNLCRGKYSQGETVLIKDKFKERLVPAWIHSFDHVRQLIYVRRFQKANSPTAPNEITVPDSDEIEQVSATRIVRSCHVRFFLDNKAVRTPYDRAGTGDHFYILGSVAGQCPFKPGWDPDAVMTPQLRGMGIFCGGGNFDRGIEEGGAVKFTHALDWDAVALHTYRANAKDSDIHYFLGSANDALARALRGLDDPTIATLGDVDIIVAGSPCQGFSKMNISRVSESALKNASMVASVVSFVDFYSPQYLILENVLSMTDNLGPNKDENVFSSMIAAFVTLGYQVQQFLGDAWAFGSAEGRSRLFIVASSPGTPLLEAPPQTHAHPPQIRRPKRSLGELSNGICFGRRADCITAFDHVSPAEVTGDLPRQGDVVPQLCTRFPDHRTSVEPGAVHHTRIASVPIHPSGMSLAKVGELGLLSHEPKQFLNGLKKGTKFTTGIHSYSRIPRDGLFPTLLTTIAIRCKKAGRVLHWDEPRVTTVMEMRRAQAYPDHEVIIGSPVNQVKIIGNSVNRKVSLALGLCLRVSWEQALEDKKRCVVHAIEQNFDVSI